MQSDFDAELGVKSMSNSTSCEQPLKQHFGIIELHWGLQQRGIPNPNAPLLHPPSCRASEGVVQGTTCCSLIRREDVQM